jgi:hypothetical protein
MSDGYEFNEYEDEIIARLGRWMQNVGTVSLLGSGAGLIYGVILVLGMVFTGHVGGSILVVVLMATPFASALALVSAGKALMAVVRTEGEDIPLVMRGMRRLTTVYILEIVLSVVALALLAYLAAWVLL